jgi:hypothetical protein
MLIRVSKVGACIAALVCVAAACASAPSTGESQSNVNGKDGTDKGSPRKGNTPGGAATGGASSGSPAGTGTTPTPPPSKCLDTSADVDACMDCCEQDAPKAINKLFDTQSACLCAADACAKDCASSFLCKEDSDADPTDACNTCMDTHGQACAEAGLEACNADAKCAAVNSCWDACLEKFPTDE